MPISKKRELNASSPLAARNNQCSPNSNHHHPAAPVTTELMFGQPKPVIHTPGMFMFIITSHFLFVSLS